MRVAILDPRIQTPGLSLVLNTPDYYIIGHNNTYDLDKYPSRFYKLYNFNYREDLNTLTSENYDVLCIVYAIKDFNDVTRPDVQHHLKHVMNILSTNTFKKVVVFDNHDEDYDPIKMYPQLNADVWFKRNYSSTVTYPNNVIPFPFLIFGHICPLWKVLKLNLNETPKVDRLLWGGGIYGSGSPQYLSRGYIANSLGSYLTIVDVPNRVYLEELSKSKFSLDMNGCGDPNIRTFEILASNSLLIQQFKYLIWPFENGDAFSEETIFKTPEECREKVDALRNDDVLYKKCLDNQLYIKNKYFTVEWLNAYITRYLS